MSSSSAEPPTSGAPAHPDQDDDGSSKEEHGADDLSMSKKGQPWTTEEHLAFLSGLKRMGKGNWRGISKHFVPSRTPTQVASHAQKHFMRLQGVTKRKSRFSALEQEVLGTASTVQKAAGGPATPSSSTSPTLPAASFPAMPFPCMMPPMMFAFPGAPMMPPMMYPPPAAMAAMAAMAAKQGFVMPMGMFPSFPGMPMGMPMAMPAMFMHHAHAAAAAGSAGTGTATPAAATASTPAVAAPQAQPQQQLQQPDSAAAIAQQQTRQPQPKESSPAAGTNTSVVVVCKPEAQHVLAERDGISLGVGLLDKLRSAKEANSALQPSTHSAFRPPGEVRAGAS